MFSTPVTPDRKFDEGVVLQVDPSRKVCRVRTNSGKVLDHVRCMSIYGGSSRYGDRYTAKKGDLVLVAVSTGYPVILGFLPKVGMVSEASPQDISGSSASLDTGNLTPETYGAVPDPHSPSDMLAGDRIISGEQGNQVAILRGGSVLLRASRLSEILLSKLTFTVRIVSKNWEHFTDSFSDTSRNISNRVFRYTGYPTSYAEAQSEQYRYHQMVGDVAAAESVNTKFYAGATPAAVGLNVFKEKATDTAGTTKMYRTIGLNGDEEVWVTNGSTFTRMKATGSALTFSFGDSSTITVDGSKIKIHQSSGADINLDSSGIQATFSGHYVNISSGGVSIG